MKNVYMHVVVIDAGITDSLIFAQLSRANNDEILSIISISAHFLLAFFSHTRASPSCRADSPSVYFRTGMSAFSCTSLLMTGKLAKYHFLKRFMSLSSSWSPPSNSDSEWRILIVLPATE